LILTGASTLARFRYVYQAGTNSRTVLTLLLIGTDVYLVNDLYWISSVVFGFDFVKVIIEGFKSYKEQVATEEFSNKVNCVGNVSLWFTCSE